MKIYSFNVNGIRSIVSKGFLDWIEKEQPDIVCLQEIKADEKALEPYGEIDGYYAFFNSAKKKGYAGVGVYTRVKPMKVEHVIGIDRFDNEGRSLKLTFDEFTLYNFYMPQGGRLKENLPYKLDTYRDLLKIFKRYKDQETILVGDFNIAHTERDVCNAKSNENSTMFTPQEREQIDQIIDLGYVDTFRDKYPKKQSYSWWSYWGNTRARDIGWRIDYIFVTEKLRKKIIDAFIRKDIEGSDHCPVGIEIRSKMKEDNPQYPKSELF